MTRASWPDLPLLGDRASSGDLRPARSLGAGWYQDAIVYELRVRSFFDANGDGIGDFPGLISKLDYLQDLGVTALWLLPFYPSPLRDDGYDISDFTDVHPECGVLADFDRFIDEAHRRGLKVITEIVFNHTSDQHPWFQRARRAPPGSPARERYVWSDTPDRYREARIIFKDFEPSNWSWDPLARAYFWHRFYAHQPDLNYDNPEVREAMLRVVDFWLARGVDGFRLDAVPYLFEREGTSCENLPETHTFLRTLRAHIDARHEGRMLLAEANGWPDDAARYFGRGDECHMVFHFPIMPRIFVAIHAEDRFPIVDILAQTPAIPEGCQWALFLRNHDELTLEMVTDEERDAMYRAYAAEPVMRLNLGIRRRLAPLAGNDRRHIELLNALLFSLPGTPVVYYGDEIGMGDNVFLGDRNGVRTPMQWSADKNAGFSRANPQRLVLPVIIDPQHHYEAVNVEAAQESPSSLLWWMKRLIAIRKRHPALGRGAIELLAPDNPRILAFVRRLPDDIVLVVANLSRLVQFVDLDLSAFAGLVPVEQFGQSELPMISPSRYPLTLAGHGFYLLSLERPAAPDAIARAHLPPSIEARAPSLAALPDAALADALAAFALAHTWGPGSGHRVESARIADVVPIGEPAIVHETLVEIAYAGGERERYAVPIAIASGSRAAEIEARAPGAVIARVAPDGVIFDATADASLTRAMLEAIATEGRVRGRAGAIVATLAPTLAERASEPPPQSDRDLPAASGRAAVMFGERYALHLSRRIDEGASPGLEISRALAARPEAARVPPLCASFEYTAGRREPATLAVLRAFVPGEAGGRVHAEDEIVRYFERVLARTHEHEAPPPFEPLHLLGLDLPVLARETVGAYLDTAGLIGRRTAELHLALASVGDDLAFAPEPATPFDQRAAFQATRGLARRVLRALAARAADLHPDTQALAARVIAAESRVLDRLSALLHGRLTALRARHHGSYDLSRIVHAQNDVIIADLDADGRSIAERRRKASPLRDVASMIRSIHEVVHVTLLNPTRVRAEDREAARPWADRFWWWSAAALLDGYLAVARDGSFLPHSRDELGMLLDVFLLEAGFAALGNALAAGAAPEPALLFLARLDDRSTP